MEEEEEEEEEGVGGDRHRRGEYRAAGGQGNERETGRRARAQNAHE